MKRLLLAAICILPLALSCKKMEEAAMSPERHYWLTCEVESNFGHLTLTAEFLHEGSSLDEIPGCEYFFLCSTNVNDFSKAERIPAHSVNYKEYSADYTPSADGTYFFKFCADNRGLSYIESEVKAVEYKIAVPPEAIDLGLPSGIKWASFNLGASKPEEYGGFYQWAGTKDVTNTSIYLDYSNCPYHTGSSYKTGWTKYNTKSSFGTVDNKTVLDPSDDVAHVNWGGSWRMPTYAEWTELIENCTWTWTTLNGINGCKVTSKKTGYTDNSIFLPAAGCRVNDELNGVGSLGYYWSSSLGTNYPYHACSFDFISDGVVDIDFDRYGGFSVRPVYDDIVPVTNVTVTPESATIVAGKTLQLTATVLPEDASDKSVTWSSSNKSVATVSKNGLVTALSEGSTVITVTTTDGGKTSICKLTVTPSQQVSGAVDMGLSVKWATCNLGASKPEEYGGYYQWAGTEDVSSTSINLGWDNCPYHAGSDETKGWTKYVPSNMSSYWSGNGSPDNKSELDLNDDAAHVNWGGSWRIPTDAEWTELRNNCTWTKTKLNEVNGYKITSKISGYTDKSIFLPAAGRRYHSINDEIGSSGCYWTSGLYSNIPCSADRFAFYSGKISIGSENRYFGYSIRPVTE